MQFCFYVHTLAFSNRYIRKRCVTDRRLAAIKSDLKIYTCSTTTAIRSEVVAAVRCGGSEITAAAHFCAWSSSSWSGYFRISQFELFRNFWWERQSRYCQELWLSESETGNENLLYWGGHLHLQIHVICTNPTAYNEYLFLAIYFSILRSMKCIQKCTTTDSEFQNCSNRHKSAYCLDWFGSVVFVSELRVIAKITTWKSSLPLGGL